MTKKKAFRLVVLVLILACALRILWVNIKFHTTYSEQELAVGEEFEDGGVLICVEDITRYDQTDSYCYVAALVTIKNPSEEEVAYELCGVELTSEWFYLFADETLTCDIYEGYKDYESYSAYVRVAAGSERTFLITYKIPYSYLKLSWDTWEEVPIFLSFLNTTTWKKVYAS